MTYTEGSKFKETRELNIVEIAKLVRKDLREAFPEYKFSVRVEKYSMGCSLNIKALNTGYGYSDLGETATEFRMRLMSAVQEIAEQYNYSDSDWQSDYHANKFYTHVKVES